MIPMPLICKWRLAVRVTVISKECTWFGLETQRLTLFFFGFCSKDVAYIWLGPNFDDFRKLKNEMFTF